MSDSDLNPESLASWLAVHPDWSRDDGSLEKVYRFDRFRNAVIFVNRVATVADEEDRYPEIDLRRDRVRVRLPSSGSGLSARDLELAEKIDYATPRR